MNTDALLHFTSTEDQVIVATVDYLNSQRVVLGNESGEEKDGKKIEPDPVITSEDITLTSRLKADLDIGTQVGITELQTYIEYVANRCGYPLKYLEILPLECLDTLTIQDVCALIEALEAEAAEQAEGALL